MILTGVQNGSSPLDNFQSMLLENSVEEANIPTCWLSANFIIVLHCGFFSLCSASQFGSRSLSWLAKLTTPTGRVEYHFAILLSEQPNRKPSTFYFLFGRFVYLKAVQCPIVIGRFTINQLFVHVHISSGQAGVENLYQLFGLSVKSRNGTWWWNSWGILTS